MKNTKNATKNEVTREALRADIRECMHAETAPKRGARVNTCGESTAVCKEREAAEAEAARAEAAKHANEFSLLPHITIPRKYVDNLASVTTAFYNAAATLAKRGDDMSEELREAYTAEMEAARHAIGYYMSMCFPLNHTHKDAPRIDNLVCKPWEDNNPRAELCDAFARYAKVNALEFGMMGSSDYCDEFNNAFDNRQTIEAHEAAKRREAAKQARREVLISSLMQAGYSAERAEEIANDAPAI